MITAQTTYKTYEYDFLFDNPLVANSRLQESICARDGATDEYNND